MSTLAATEVTGCRSDTAPEQIRAAFYGRKNRTDTDALHLLGRQYQVCEQTFRARVVMTRCFYDLPSSVDAAMLQAAGLPRREGGWDDLGPGRRGCARLRLDRLCDRALGPDTGDADRGMRACRARPPLLRCVQHRHCRTRGVSGGRGTRTSRRRYRTPGS